MKKSNGSFRKKRGIETAPSSKINSSISASLQENIRLFDELFADVDIMLSRQFENALQPAIKFCIYYSDGVTDPILINEHIIKPLTLLGRLTPVPTLFAQVRDHAVTTNDVKECTDVTEIISGITYGDTVFFIEGSEKALLFSSKKFSLRSSTEPEGERVLSGPREGFTEGFMNNLSMIRRRLRTNELKIRLLTMGRLTQTTVCVACIDNSEQELNLLCLFCLFFRGSQRYLFH